MGDLQISGWRRFRWFAGSWAVPAVLALRLVVVGRIANLVPTGEAQCPGARWQHTGTDLPRTTLPISLVARRVDDTHGYGAGY